MKSRAPSVSRRLATLWGPHSRQLSEAILQTAPAPFDRLEMHLLLIDARQRFALWAARHNAPPSMESTEDEVPAPALDGLREDNAANLPHLWTILEPVLRGRPPNGFHCFPLARQRRVVGLLLCAESSASGRTALRRHARMASASLALLQSTAADQRELEGYRALSHLLDVGAPRDRRALAKALGRSMAEVTHARMCLILARADATQPLMWMGSRGYPGKKAQSLVLWPEEEPWASVIERDAVGQVDPQRLDANWRGVVGSAPILIVPVRWQGWVRSVLLFPADTAETGGAPLVMDAAQLASVGAQANLLWQNAELLARLRRDEEVLQGLMQRSNQVQEEERRRIASDIHDGVTQRIVGIWYQLQALEKKLEPPPDARGQAIRNALQTIKDQVDLTMQEARAAIYNLRPSTLDDLGLIPSIRSLAVEFRHDTDVVVDLEVVGERRLPDYMEVGIYRICQEALRNVKKHARATAVRLQLQMGEDKVRLTITDNGRGFQRKKRDVGGRLQSFGLESMEERAQMLGAQLFLQSTSGGGTSIRVSIPVPRPDVPTNGPAHPTTSTPTPEAATAP